MRWAVDERDNLMMCGKLERLRYDIFKDTR